MKYSEYIYPAEKLADERRKDEVIRFKNWANNECLSYNVNNVLFVNNKAYLCIELIESGADLIGTLTPEEVEVVELTCSRIEVPEIMQKHFGLPPYYYSFNTFIHG